MHNSIQKESKEQHIKQAQSLIKQKNNNNTKSVTYQKVTEKPVLLKLSASERVRLIQQGNKCLNENNIEQAKKIFTTIGYKEGLKSIARYYADKGNMIGAYLMFRQAGAKETERLEQNIIHTIKTLLS